MQRILIVDDEPVNRRIMKAILAKGLHDVIVLEAEDGVEALAMMKAHRVSVLILDIVMPGKDGIEVLQEVKSNKEWEGIAVIMCTAVDEMEKAKRALDLGAMDYLTKPLTEEQIKVTLLLKVRNAIRSYEQHTQLLSFYQRIKEDLQFAETLQKAMIKDHQDFDGAFMKGRYRPCEEIGGDFYVCKEEDGRLWFMIADIVGHGISAAMMSTAINVLFNSILGDSRSPGEALERINRSLFRDFSHTHVNFISAFMGCLWKDKFSYANAGQPYPVLWRAATQQATEIRQNGYLLGFDEDCAYQTETITIASGDAIVHYTDGLFDLGGEGQFGNWSAIEHFCQHHGPMLGNDVDGFLDQLIAYFHEQGANGFIDDVAVMLIRKE